MRHHTAADVWAGAFLAALLAGLSAAVHAAAWAEPAAPADRCVLLATAALSALAALVMAAEAWAAHDSVADRARWRGESDAPYPGRPYSWAGRGDPEV